MSRHSLLHTAGAFAVLAVAVGCMAVIAFGFIAPETMLDTVGVVGYLAATVLMLACAVVAMQYDLRGIIYSTVG